MRKNNASQISELTEAWEAAAKLPEHKKCRQVIIRSGVVLGKHGGIIRNILLPYMLYLGGPLGSGNQLFPWIHVRDLARMFMAAVHQNEITGILNGVAPQVRYTKLHIFYAKYILYLFFQVITNKQFAESFAKALKRPAFFPTPEFLLKLIFAERAKASILQDKFKFSIILTNAPLSRLCCKDKE